jgi:L-rhamnose isomerase/sugar isomerase
MDEDSLFTKLDAFKIETPSWGYADTGTRFGKFLQPAAAKTIEEKIEDAAEVHRVTGACPSMAVHVQWDFPKGRDPRQIAKLATDKGIRIGAINPNFFQDQVYKFGSVCSPWPDARTHADLHMERCLDVAAQTGSKTLSLWFADGTNYPGQDDLISRKRLMQESLRRWHGQLEKDMTMLVEYKPFEPAFYHTDIADWGMAYTFAKHAGPRAKVLVDTGHHFQGVNIEHIVAFLLDEGMLGGFHFNDRKYADDDLTLGSIDPYAIFRIFLAIRLAEERHGLDTSKVEYMIDQSHNLKPKVEAMIQTVVIAQELFAKACLVDLDQLTSSQIATDIVAAETCLKSAFFADVSGLISTWRQNRGLTSDPIAAHRSSGYTSKMETERSARRAASGEASESSYA